MKPFPVKEGVQGFLFAGVSTGIKKNKKDLGLILCDKPSVAAGVFTKNRVKAAPVILCKKRLNNGFIQAVLANSGNANACTGEKGLKDAAMTCAGVASHLKINESYVAPCSTGVIGVDLPTKKIMESIPKLVKKASTDGIPDFAESILTTDRNPKIVAVKDNADGETVKVCGIAKGAGMIMPNMATMLAFIVSNAAIEGKFLSHLLKQHTEKTFNRITVDGDMSTNDTILVLANGNTDKIITSGSSKTGRSFSDMLFHVMENLSLMIVKDGEGATKLITVKVLNAKNHIQAKKAAQQVANSNLVKTAFFGEDFNWGRIMAALGSSGAHFYVEKVDIFFNGIQAVRKGLSAKENINKIKKIVKMNTINVSIDLNQGRESCEITTCDLGYDYIKINADYTS